jgi:hypothetical protein
MFQISTSPLHIFVVWEEQAFQIQLLKAKLEGEFVFFFSKCLFVDDLFLVLIIHVFWDNFG